MGVFNPIFEAMGSVLSWLYAIVPNYGIAIIMLTVLVRLVLYPLTAKQARSMIAMQRVQPEIKKLQAKYKDDKQKLNEEMMKFYKENKINPFGGCLPLLAQMPIFISLFRVLHDPQKYTPVNSAFHQNMCAGPNCKVVSMPFFGMDLSLSAGGSHGSFANALPYWILVGLVVVTAYLQQRQTMKNSPSGGNPQAQIIGKVMPLVFAFISINLPAGVVLYFFVSNLWQMGQQELIIRKMDGGSPAAGAGSKRTVDAKSTESPTGAAGFLARFTKPANAPSDAVDGGSAPEVDGNGSGKGSGKDSKSAPPSNGAQGGSSGSRSGASGGGGGSGRTNSPSNKRRSNKKRRR